MPFNFKPAGLFRIPHLRYKRLWVYIGLAMLFGILSLSVISVPKVVMVFLWSDKLLHGIVYAGLMGWFAQIFRHDLARLLLVFVFISFGVSMEYLQALTPSRHFEVADMIANSCGVVLAWALSYTILGSILERVELYLPKGGDKVTA